MPTSKTSSSSILVPKTTIPLVSMMGWGLRSSFWVVFFLQSRMRVMVCLCTLMATRCHLKRKVKLIHTLTGLHAAHSHTGKSPFCVGPLVQIQIYPFCFLRCNWISFPFAKGSSADFLLALYGVLWGMKDARLLSGTLSSWKSFGMGFTVSLFNPVL